MRNTQMEYSHSEFAPTTDIDPGMVQRPPIKATVTLENYRRGRSAKLLWGRVFQGVPRVEGCAVIAPSLS